MADAMDLLIGEEPKPISYGSLYNFNKVFRAMFKWFSEGNEDIVSIWMESNPRDPLSLSSLTISNVRRWLRYYQLITVKTVKEPLPEPDGFRKNRTKRIIKPTKLGFIAYDQGKVLQVKAGSVSYNTAYKVGIGLAFSYWDKLESLGMELWKRERISQSRRWKWHSELREFFVYHLLDREAIEAKSLLHAWAFKKAADWNREHPRGRSRRKSRILEPPRYLESGEVILENGQQILLDGDK